MLGIHGRYGYQKRYAVSTWTRAEDRAVSLVLKKVPHVRYTYSVDVGGETFHPCDLLVTLTAVRQLQVELWNISKKKLDVLNAVGALTNAAPKQLGVAGPKIDDYISDLTALVTGDADLYRLWRERHAERYHTGVLAQ